MNRRTNLILSIFITLLILSGTVGVYAQSFPKKALADVSEERARNIVGFLADDLLEGDLLEEKPDNDRYYLDDDAREYAQFLFENPEYRVLFDATRKIKKEDMQIVKELYVPGKLVNIVVKPQ
mgnify:CR=1 FL=1